MASWIICPIDHGAREKRDGIDGLASAKLPAWRHDTAGDRLDDVTLGAFRAHLDGQIDPLVKGNRLAAVLRRSRLLSNARPLCPAKRRLSTPSAQSRRSSEEARIDERTGAPYPWLRITESASEGARPPADNCTCRVRDRLKRSVADGPCASNLRSVDCLEVALLVTFSAG
jgi:hypothetical protein